MQELTLVRDFTVILVLAGAITLLFRWLKQPPILGYLIAGLLVGPFTTPVGIVSDAQAINHIADLGLVLVFFGIGLEFNWSKVRSAGGSILFIGILECAAMTALGYGIGIMLGLSQLGALFLGNAMQVSSSAIVSKILSDSGKLNAPFARLVMGALLVEDFVSIAVFTLLTMFTATGTADLHSLGLFSLHLVVFIVVLVVLGVTAVPRLMRFTRQLKSKEALLITSLALCFASALFGQFLGQSVAIGAFIMGSLIGDTPDATEVNEVINPVKQLFAAVFFVAMGMLIDVSLLRDYIVPTVIVVAVFIAGKVLINATATFLAGYDGRTALNEGMCMPQMGEFSLVIMKAAVEKSVVAPFLYPVVALCTAITCFTTPYLMRASDSTADLIERSSPSRVKSSFQRLAGRIQTFYSSINQDTVAAFIVRHTVKIILINLLILALLIGLGTFALQFLEEIGTLTGLEKNSLSILTGIITLILCLPSFIIILRNVQSLVEEGIAHMLKDQPAGHRLDIRKIQRIQAFLRHGLMGAAIIYIALWFIPFMIRLFTQGVFAMIFPVLIGALLIYVAVGLSFNFHVVLERMISKAFLGKEHQSSVGQRVTERHNHTVQKIKNRKK